MCFFYPFHLRLIITKYILKVQNYSNVCSVLITLLFNEFPSYPTRIQYQKSKEKSKYNTAWDRMSTLALNEQ